MRRFFVCLFMINIFVFMKRSWIWIICTIMGTSFLVLLYLQMRYADTMVKMRRDQFDETVYRSLDQASRELERMETFTYLQSVIAEHDKAKSLLFMAQDSLEIALIKYNKKTWCKSALLGFFVGLAVIVPGISGSTVAIIFKLYDQFLYAIGNLFKKFKQCFGK